MLKIYLIRHGQTTGDIEDRYGGDYDDHLSEEGKLQANALKEKLVNEGIEIIYCSSKIRAQETAAIIQKGVNCGIVTIDDLRERNQYGILTGTLKAEAKEKYPDLFELVKDFRNTLPNAEPYESFKERVLKVWEKLLSCNQKTIAIVAHGGQFRVIFREILGKEIKIEDGVYAFFENTNGDLNLIRTDGIVIES